MKKKLFLIFLIILSVFFIPSVSASTKTFERTEEDLLLPKGIKATPENLSNIMMTPAVDAKEKVYDFGEILTTNEEKKLYEEIVDYINQTNMDVAIVTVKYNNKHNVQTYAEDFYDYNNFGVGSERDGILYVIDMDLGQIYLTATGKAIRTYSDKRYNNMLDNAFQFVLDGDYYGSCSSLIKSALSYSKIDSTEDDDYVVDRDGTVKKDNSSLLAIGIFAIIGTAITMLILVNMNRTVYKAKYNREYLMKDTASIKRVNEVALGTQVARAPRKKKASPLVNEGAVATPPTTGNPPVNPNGEGQNINNS